MDFNKNKVFLSLSLNNLIVQMAYLNTPLTCKILHEYYKLNP